MTRKRIGRPSRTARLIFIVIVKKDGICIMPELEASDSGLFHRLGKAAYRKVS